MTALGGGGFTLPNKVLPGSYINTISRPRASEVFGDRGFAAIALALDWGVTGEIIELQKSDLQNDSLEILGYPYTHEALKPIREILIGAQTLYLWNLNSQSVKATAKVGELILEAKCGGIVGNDIMVRIMPDADQEGNYIVTIRLGDVLAYQKSVASVEEIDNNHVDFKGVLTSDTVTVGTKLAGGENGIVTAEDHTNFLGALEEYNVNAVGCATNDDEVKRLYHSYCQRMRDEAGVKLQDVIYEPTTNKFNYEGTIEVHNKTLDNKEKPYEAVYYVTGIAAGCQVNASNTNLLYNGEYNIEGVTKTREAEKLLKQGKFVFYSKNKEIRVLEDINSFIEFTLYKNEDFSKNQVIRVIDQRAKDIAIIFNSRYLGKVLNNKDGRVSFWKELVNHAEKMEGLGAIEDYVADETTVEKGKMKDEVIVHDPLMPIMAMQKLYMTIHVI